MMNGAGMEIEAGILLALLDQPRARQGYAVVPFRITLVLQAGCEQQELSSASELVSPVLSRH